MTLKFQLHGTIYDVSDVHELSLKYILQLENETRDFGRPITLVQLQEMADAVEAIRDERERAVHPDAPWLLGITVWASRKLAGEPVTFEQAIDFPMSALKFLPTPQDRKAPAKRTPQKARPVKASGRAVAAQADAAAK